MTDVQVMLSVDPITAKVAIDNIAVGNNVEEKAVVIDSTVSFTDVTDHETTDDRLTLSDVEVSNMIKKSISDYDDKSKTINNIANLGSGRRKRHRRGKSKKRKWKPYNKLTWDEKRQQEDRESLRAHRVRAERFAHGKPVAPYNTTQFLMDDHNVQEPDLEDVPNGGRVKNDDDHHRQRRESGMDSDNYYSSPEDEEEFLQKEFCQVYQNIHAERLSSLTKIELIHEYMTLEDRIEVLEQRINDEKGLAGEKTRQFQNQIKNLEEEVRQLKSENDKLKTLEQVLIKNQILTEKISADTGVVGEEDEMLSNTCESVLKVELCSEQVMES